MLKHMHPRSAMQLDRVRTPLQHGCRVVPDHFMAGTVVTACVYAYRNCSFVVL